MDSAKQGDGQPALKRRNLDADLLDWSDRFPNISAFVPPVSNPIPRMTEPSLERFERYMLKPRDMGLGPEPLIVTQALGHWPARDERPWSSPEYLLSRTIGGRRLVPIETGRSYVDDGWGQTIVTFKEFMELYIFLDPKSSHAATGYLAQHDLFA